jgi:cytochrome o ubiquinol oxidase operon protein cyoD
MSKNPHIIEPPHGAGIGTYKSYALGYLLCIALTLAAYFAVTLSLFSGPALVTLVVGLGVSQVIVQLILFIHLNAESKPRWNTIVFLFMLLVTVTIVIGSLWIMANLNYRVMEPM